MYREAHKAYLQRGLEKLGSDFICLDASKPWLIYWMLNSLDILDESLGEYEARAISTISSFQNELGGFGGGFMQYSHLAPTYSAINSLAIVGTPEAFDSIDRDALLRFLFEMKQEDGSFIMHEGGEVDVRGSYCAISVAILLGILTPELERGVAEFVAKCQTYEGGLGGTPGDEAHGGYTFCGLATLCLLNRLDLIDTDRLLIWALGRQLSAEGGFNGRTNKLVDGCYSFWVGGIFALLGYNDYNKCTHFLILVALQEYIMYCCQLEKGGFVDKPGKSRDYYHTCYVLSGLSVSQHMSGGLAFIGPESNVLVNLFNSETN